MPWSPIPKFPEIIHSIKQRGQVNETNLRILEDEIMWITGAHRDATVKQIVKTMSRLGFIKMNPKTDGQTYFIYTGERYKFKGQMTEAEEKKEIDKRLQE